MVLTCWLSGSGEEAEHTSRMALERLENKQRAYHGFISQFSDLHHFNLDLLEIRDLRKESAIHDHRPLQTRTLMTLTLDNQMTGADPIISS